MRTAKAGLIRYQAAKDKKATTNARAFAATGVSLISLKSIIAKG